jgi:anti-sigma regulatory factor (Ser/Thr protein kinase)
MTSMMPFAPCRPPEQMPGLTKPIPEVRERLVLRSGGEDLDALYPWFDAISGQLGLPASAAFRIHVVLEEAVTNAVLHGYDPDCSGDVSLEIAATPAHVVAILRDSGKPFNPLLQSEAPSEPTPVEDALIGGLGLKLMRSYCSALAYQRADKTNELTMGFDVDAMAKLVAGDK